MTHQARKRFGQNFLHDSGVIHRIIDAIQPETRTHIIEIGPGQAALTNPLIAASKQLTVIEIDRDLAAILQKRENEHFKVIIGDALQFDFSTLSQGEKLTVVGNLPYNISTPILFHLMQYQEQIDDLFFMLQKEVVERMAASPREKEYGRLSIMIQYFCAVNPLFQVGPHSFSPAPKVDSMVVHLRPWKISPHPKLNDFKRFSLIVQHAFSQRRKTLRNALSQIPDLSVPEIFAKKRAEELSVSDFIALANIEA
ncbi:MAG: 16S rRNA (adenine(1518)-N(6)/adenine(1519)-N(6))-dimethyltransferase RsmA [Gammaproteobacteria bacterium]|nr:16S rRNA (adenine(1518)-N(6)/adenine(1519)-N(6))-dimethyltransferase RsmA [Gammaproteobacteria bacterium]